MMLQGLLNLRPNLHDLHILPIRGDAVNLEYLPVLTCLSDYVQEILPTAQAKQILCPGAPTGYPKSP